MVVQSGMAAEHAGAWRRVKERGKAPVGSLEHQSVVKSFKELNAAMVGPNPRRMPAPDARYAASPALETQAVAYHEARLAELANSPAPALSEALAAKYAPPALSEAWPGPPQPTAAPGASWARHEESYEDGAIGF